MGRGRPGGNPDYHWKPTRGVAMEPLNLRVLPELLKELKAIEGWQDKARDALAALVEAEKLKLKEAELSGSEAKPATTDRN
jgi:hypothetical protein